MTKANLTKSSGNYILTSESGTVTDLGRRYPSSKRMRAALRAALYEECEVLDKTGGANDGTYMQVGSTY